MGAVDDGRTWRFVAALVLVAAAACGVVAMRRYAVELYAQLALAGAAGLGVAQIFLGEPDRHNVRRHAKRSMAITFGLTWLVAVVSAAVVTRASKEEAWFATLLLSASSVGGFFALQRSARTRSETGAGLREISALRVTSLSAPLVDQRVNALEVRTVDELIAVAVRMLRLAVSLPLTPSSHLVDKSALWAYDDQAASWFVVASSSMDARDVLSFPAVTVATPAGGIIPNLAIAAPPPPSRNAFLSGDVFLCGADVRTHPWFRAAGGGTAEGMAVVLLRQNGRVLGALSLTSRTAGAIPVAGSECSELVEILALWSKSFVVPIARLYSLRETSP